MSFGRFAHAQEVRPTLGRLLRSLRHRAEAGLRATRRGLARWTRPATPHSVVLGSTADLMPSESALMAENAPPRQQLIVLTRTAKRPRLSRADRACLVRLASRVRAWLQTVLIVRPETLVGAEKPDRTQAARS